MKNSFKYEVAISFAEEDRNAAIALALALELVGFNHIYYYPDNLAATAGKTLIPELQKIFLDDAKYIAVLLSSKYLGKKSGSPAKGEFEVIQRRVSESNSTMTVLPILLNKSLSLSAYPDLEGLGYFYWDFNPKGAATILKENFGLDKPFAINSDLPFVTKEQIIHNKQINRASVTTNQHNEIHINLNQHPSDR